MTSKTPWRAQGATVLALGRARKWTANESIAAARAGRRESKRAARTIACARGRRELCRSRRRGLSEGSERRGGRGRPQRAPLLVQLALQEADEPSRAAG